MIARPVAVIPLACGRLELGLWPCGQLDRMVRSRIVYTQALKVIMSPDTLDPDTKRD